MSFADQSRGLLAANPSGRMGQITTPPRTMIKKVFSYTLALATAAAMGCYVYAGAVAGFTLLNTPTHTQN